MSLIPAPDAPVAIVCGSDSLVGNALVSRLGEAQWRIVTIDSPGADEHHAAESSFLGPLEDPATWQALREHLRLDGLSPRAFIHAVSGFAGPDSPRGADQKKAAATFCGLVDGAALGCEHIMPLMAEGDAGVVLLASMLAGWDTRAGANGYSASQGGLLALARSLALSGGPDGIRVNAVAAGLVAEDHDGQAVPAVAGRIPLGQVASPDDIVDAIMFLLSAGARHVTGTTLVVDGGQSLQSWSNALREGHYPQLLASADPQPQPPPTSRLPGPSETAERALLPSARSEGRRVGDEGSAPGMRASHPYATAATSLRS
ncbi:MAG TPA: SDR family oxidoreductase, partial [Thermomicrobiales bacterium]|nr:SDR family oxidoreductase [Thermomicrobiales bacterium]